MIRWCRNGVSRCHSRVRIRGRDGAACSSSLATVESDYEFPSDSPKEGRFPHTFTPLHVSPHISPLSNRVMMGSIHCGLEPHSIPSWLLRYWGSSAQHHGPEALAEYYAERARGQVGLIVTGGIAPNRRGWVGPFAAKLTNDHEVSMHRVVTDTVHAENSGQTKICMQILHAGRYAMHPLLAAPSALKAPINVFTPWAMSHRLVTQTIRDYVRCAVLAREAGYDGVEIMGSEGYLIHQFLSPQTNRRTDEYGGPSLTNRMRFALDIVKGIRQATGPDFLLIYRLSMLDLMDEASAADWEEVTVMAQALEDAGVHVLNTGIGWHEARVPTIATCVPRAAFVPATTQKLKKANVVDIPLVATNRINDPDTVENLLAITAPDGAPDLISMARPFLADPHIVRKMYDVHQNSITNHNNNNNTPLLNVNTCIGCNQACLDHVFVGRVASCLVNPKAGHELEFYQKENERLRTPQKLAVVGAGPAGLAMAVTAAELGHRVTLFDDQPTVGGQFHLAKQIPGKEEFYETLRYFRNKIKMMGGGKEQGGTIDLRLNTRVNVNHLTSTTEAPFDKVVIATGVTPRTPPIPGIDHPKVLSYVQVLRDKVKVGHRVAIIGAGGIGFDVAEYLLHNHDDQNSNHYPTEDDHSHVPANNVNVSSFFDYWGIDPHNNVRGGLLSSSPSPTTNHHPAQTQRQITILQRKHGKLGSNLGKTTGWIHRTQLKKGHVQMVGGCSYQKIDDDGNLHVQITTKQNKLGSVTTNTEHRVLHVDNIVLCAGQDPQNNLATDLVETGRFLPHQVLRIGGAYRAGELDAKRAIDMGVRLAYDIDLEEPRVVDEEKRDKGDEERLFDMMKKIMGK